MDSYEIRRLYGKGRDAALEAYPAAIEENKDNEDRLNELAFLAADFAHPEAIALLFEAGVSPMITDKYKFTLLHYLGKQYESNYYIKPKGAVTRTVELLLDNKVSALRKDDNENMTCYHYAARNGLTEMVEALAERGVKLNMTDRDGNTGIHVAAEYARSAVSNIGYKKRELESSEANYKETAARLKARDMTDEQIEQYVNNNMTNPKEKKIEYDEAVQKAEDYLLLIKAFVKGGVDIDEKNNYGQTALDIAVEYDVKKIAAYLSGSLTGDSDEDAVAAGGMTLHQAAEKGDAAAIKAIIKTGADINGIKDGDEYKLGGCTALAIAVMHFHADAVEALLAGGADPSFKDGKGQSAVNYLVKPKPVYSSRIFQDKSIPKIIKLLLSAGMDINMTVNDDSDTLLTLVCKSSRGTGYNSHTLKGDIIDEVLKNAPDINHTNRFGETALMHSCKGDFEMMENIQLTLLEQGADVSAVDINGDTALHYAASNDNKTGAKILCDMLLEFGADVNAINNSGRNALDIATETDNEPLVKLLLSKI